MFKSVNKGVLFRCLFAFFLFLTLSFLFFSNDSYAASFTHKHSDECYADVQRYASHSLRNHYDQTTHHCPRCGTMKTFRVSVWTETCSGPCKPVQVAYTVTCTSCGYVETDDKVEQPSGHYYTVRSTVCGKDETSSPAATVSLAPVSVAPTNTAVTLDASVAVEDANFALADAPYDFGLGFGTSPTFEVTENGTYNVSVMDNQGRVVSTSVTIDCIDKDLPLINSIEKSTNDWSEDGVTITVDASDEKSGLAENAYSFEGRAFSSNNSYLVTHNGNISVRVKDAAGNVTESVIAINNVGRDPAVVAEEEREYRERLELERKLKEEAERKALEEQVLAQKEAEKKALEKKALEDARKKKEALEKAKKEEVSGNNALGTGKTSKLITYRTADGRYKVYLGKDASGNDIFKIVDSLASVSGNDVSDRGNKINVKKTDLSAKVKDEVEISSLSEFGDGNEDSPKWVYASFGSLSLKVGMALAVIGIVFFSFFNYVYVREKSKVRLVTLCKVKISDNKVIVSVNSKRFKGKDRYLLYFSPWVKMKAKNLPVYIKMDDSKNLIYCDNAQAFIY